MTFTSVLGIIFYITCFVFILRITYKRKWYELNEKSLMHQKLFWLSILIPVISFIYFGIFAWWGKTPVLSAHGYARFYEISKFPLMLLASAVPLGAIINNIHRTIQTAKQLERTEHQIILAKEKNRSDSFYAHQKSYAEIFKTVPSFIVSRDFIETDENKKYIELSIAHPYILYMNIFTHSSIENGYNKTVSENFINRVQDYYKKISMSIAPGYNEEISYDFQIIYLKQLEVNVIQLCRELGIDYRYEKHEFIIYNHIMNEATTISFSDEKQIKQMITGMRDMLVHVYTLIGLNPEFFQTPKGLWDVIPDYGYDNKKIFPDVLPRT